jgi:hypothetical protein
MTGDVERQNKALTLLEYTEARQKLNIIADIVRRLGSDFAELGKLLGKCPADISVESCLNTLDYKKFSELVSDYRTAQVEAERLADDLTGKGVSF